MGGGAMPAWIYHEGDFLKLEEGHTFQVVGGVVTVLDARSRALAAFQPSDDLFAVISDEEPEFTAANRPRGGVA